MRQTVFLSEIYLDFFFLSWGFTFALVLSVFNNACSADPFYTCEIYSHYTHANFVWETNRQRKFPKRVISANHVTSWRSLYSTNVVKLEINIADVMAVQKQNVPSFASIISILSIVFSCAGFLRVELELRE